jgi:2-keto-4-pentenoate hydratase/2-oxohepta-3-ene-1,7-dioic acid hydratase in catechol pathway
MKLATFLPPGAPAPVAGEVRGEEVVELGESVRDRLASGEETPAAGRAWPLADVTLVAPVPKPRVIFGVGLNYRAHAEEQGRELPSEPQVWMKLPSSAAPPSGPVRCPEIVKRLDYEGELALVMGAGNRVAGYAVANDVSARDLQRRETHWTRAKGFDTSCPFGPWVTTDDEVPDLRDLRLRTWVNGELRQDSSTSDLIFGPDEIIDFITATCTIEPGDVILTGTPGGVGFAMDPPRYLQSGDVVRIEIERRGSIEHAVA